MVYLSLEYTVSSGKHGSWLVVSVGGCLQYEVGVVWCQSWTFTVRDTNLTWEGNPRGTWEVARLRRREEISAGTRERTQRERRTRVNPTSRMEWQVHYSTRRVRRCTRSPSRARTRVETIRVTNLVLFVSHVPNTQPLTSSYCFLSSEYLDVSVDKGEMGPSLNNVLGTHLLCRNWYVRWGIPDLFTTTILIISPLKMSLNCIDPVKKDS